MADALVDAAVNTDRWLMESVHKDEAESRQQDAKSEGNVKDNHGIEIVAVLSRNKTCHKYQCSRHYMAIVLDVLKENAVMPSCI